MARFCPECGVALDDWPGTLDPEELPTSETGDVPVDRQRAEAHWFGVAPPQVLLAVAAGVFVVALVLFAIGRWPFGLILLGAAVLLIALYLEDARRRPRTRLELASADARGRARSTYETLRARSDAAAERRRIQNRLVLVESSRRAAFLELGEAAYRRDERVQAAARSRLEALDADELALRAELDRVHARAGERIRLARLPVDETVFVPPQE